MKNLLIIFTLLSFTIISAQEIKFGKVSKEELEEKFHPLDSTADAAYLYKEKKITYDYSGNDGWSIATKVHERIKIYSKDGFDYATKKINLFTRGGKEETIRNLKAYTFFLDKNKDIKKIKFQKKDIFSENKNKNWVVKKITMPNVNEGVVIDLTYKIVSPYYYYIDKIQLQEAIPIKKTNIIVKIPEYFNFKKHQKGYYPIQLNSFQKNRRINYSYREKNCFNCASTTKYTENVDLIENVTTVKTQNTPALKQLEYVANINEYKSSLLFEISYTRFPNSSVKYFNTTWKDVIKSINKSPFFGDELNKKSHYKKDLNLILKTVKSDSEKIATIYNFVKSKIKWNGSYSKYVNKNIKKAYKEGSGNSAEINLTLTSMLRYAGINANPVLVSTKNNGTPIFPTQKGFNYVITKVNLANGKYILLDATSLYSYPNILPYRSLNWYGREVLENNTSNQIKLVPTIHSKENNILNIKINDLGEVNGMLRKSLTRHSAMFYRQKNNIKKEEDIISDLEDKHSIEIENFNVFNSENLSKPITQTIKFTSEDFIEEINGKLYFSPLFFLATKENPFKSEERNFPVDYGMPWQDNFSVAISIPENYTVASFPEDLAIGLPDNLGVFKFKTTVQGNKIKLSSVIQINNNIIAPQFYSALREFYKQLVEKQTEKIVLTKK